MKAFKSTLILTIFMFTIFTKVFTAPAAKTDNVTAIGGDKSKSQKSVSTHVTGVQRSNTNKGETIKRIDNEQTRDKQKTTETKSIELKMGKATSGITLKSETTSVAKSETKVSKGTQFSGTSIKRPAVAKTKVSLAKQVKPSSSSNLPIREDKTKISVVKQVISSTSTKQPAEDKTKVKVTTRTQQRRVSPTSTKQPIEDKTNVRVTTTTQQRSVSPTSTKQPTQDKTKVRVTTRTQQRKASNIETRSKILGTSTNTGVTGKSAILPSTSVVGGLKETAKTNTAQNTNIKQTTNINLPSSMKSKETTETKSNEQTKRTLKGSQNVNSAAKTVTSHGVTSNKELRTSGAERKSNNVQRNIVTTVTTTEATATEGYDTVTTWDGLDCNSRFKPHPEDKSKFEAAFSDNVFEKIYQSCPAPLIWRQEQCRCGWADPEIFDKETTCKCCSQGLRSHPSNPSMYQRLVNGQWSDEICSTYDNNQLWNDDNCTCVWDPNKPQSHKAPVFRGAILPRMMTKCMNLVNMTLDEGLKDANGRDLTPIFGGHRIRVVDETGNIGKSIEIRRAPFKLGIFNGNDLQSTVYFKFNFKVHDSRVRQRKKMVIISNGCRRRWQRKTIQPSLEVSFIPSNETFEVQFSTTGKRIIEYMKGSKDVNGWYQCVLYLQDRVLNFKVNGQKVYSTNGMSGGVKSTDCPLTVAGSPTNAKNHFDGYLDEFQVVKQCKYDQDTI